MRGNPVFEPAAGDSDPPLINQSQQFKGTKQSAASTLPAAARWHRAACPHPRKAESSPLQFPLQFCWIYCGGKKSHSDCRWRPRTKTAPGCLSCVHTKGHLEPFPRSHRMVCHYIMKQLSNVWNKGVLLKEIKTRKARQKKINPIFSVPLAKEKKIPFIWIQDLLSFKLDEAVLSFLIDVENKWDPKGKGIFFEQL